MKLKTLLLVFLLPVTCYATPQDKWIDKLYKCESGGRPYITVLDTNNKYSYGGLQFQLDTFYYFGQKYGIIPDDMPKKEAKLLIHNIYVQRAIAREMLDDGLSYHWKNCTNIIGTYPRGDT